MSKLKSGADQAHGGKREGAGRKPDWLKAKCAKLLENKGLLNYLARVGSGEETEQQVIVVRDGKDSHTEVVDVKCSTRDRLHAIEMLMDRGFGRPSQELQHVVEGQGRFVLVCPDAPKK